MGNGLTELEDIKISLNDLEVGGSVRIDAIFAIFDPIMGKPKHHHKGLADVCKTSETHYSVRNMWGELYETNFIFNRARWEKANVDDSEESPFKGRPYLKADINDWGYCYQARIYSHDVQR